MRVLEYSDLDARRVGPQYEKVKRRLEEGDLRSADLKKLSGGFYRAKLDYANRLILKLMRHGGERVALALEVVENHAYDRSRFLRGAAVDEDKIPPVQPEEIESADLPELAYVNPVSTRFHLLDKVLSLDDAQEWAYRQEPPLVLIGSAGSGKTALALEKLKLASGDVLYVTLSAHLAEHARDLYFANGYTGEHQNADFLSLRELVETVHVPTGREVDYREFRGFVARHRQAFRDVADAHKLFEEFRGVLTGPAIETPWLSREAYGLLGVRQSLFLDDERSRVYDLFEKYLAWLRADGLYDVNVVAQEAATRAPERYDFVVVDEAQDLTNIQLTLVLRMLRRPGAFLLCGDANQVVHPNFFSWANVKTLFFERADLAPQHQIQILRANYRNAAEVTDVANRLLKVKAARFGSVDRESHYLVEAVADNHGTVELAADREAAVRDLDVRTSRSVHCAVIVLREDDKAEAARRFRTPLLFSVQEAKGLEYENIILYNLVSGARSEFAQVAAGVTHEDLGADLSQYARAADKKDKSLERYKFFVNGLYVAITRAVRRVFFVESDTAHPLLALLGVREAAAPATLAAEASSTEEWQREARRLELQGKQAQAEAIRQTVLHERRVPWTVFDPEQVATAVKAGLDPACISSKLRRQLLEYSAVYGETDIALRLADLGVIGHAAVETQATGLRRKHLAAFEAKNPRDALNLVDEHGVDFRNAFNFTPLMLAAEAGNEDLARRLVDRGADPELVDNGGRTALHLALARARLDAQYAAKALPALWTLLAPSSLSLRVDEQLVKIDAHRIEYVLFQSMYALLRELLCHSKAWRPGVRATDVLGVILALPAAALSADRRRREYLNGVLARNEIGRDLAYNRRLFLRLSHGRYALSPGIEVRRGDAFVPVYGLMGIDRMASLGLAGYVEAREWLEESRERAIALRMGRENAGPPSAAERT